MTSSEKTFFPLYHAECMMQRKKLYGSDGDRATTLSLSVHTFCHTGNSTANTGDIPLPGLQFHSWTLSLQGSLYQSNDAEAEGWTKQIMMKLQWGPLPSARPLSLTSLCHSGYKLQGICIWPDTFSDDTSLKSFLLHQCQTSALLFHMMFFQRQGVYYLNFTQLASFIPVRCIYAGIFLSFPPAQSILANSKSMNFGKHPAGKSPVIQGRLLLLLLVLLSTTLQMLSRRSCLLGVWFEVPVPGGTFPRSCLGLWSDPSSTFLAEKKWIRFTENWSHTYLKNYSYFYCAKAKWVFLACAFYNIWVIWLLRFCHTSLQRQLHLG